MVGLQNLSSWFFLAVVFISLNGCGFRSATSPEGSVDESQPSRTVALQRVMALGTLQPADGTLSIIGPPGDRVARLNVVEGQTVSAGEVLIELESVRVRQLELQNAERNLAAAQQNANDKTAIADRQQDVELMKMNLQAARLVSPRQARVLAIDASVGTTTGMRPLMQLADTRKMVCIAEVNVADLSRVAVNQTSVITSPAFRESMNGKVLRISPLIAPPMLTNPNPMAAVDRHTAKVTIAIDDAGVARASELIGLQVDVTIRVGDTSFNQ